jgi:hypothetical protein
MERRQPAASLSAAHRLTVLPLVRSEFADLELFIDSIPALIHTSLPDGYP